MPKTKHRELSDGVPVVDNAGNRLGDSKIAAREGIGSVVFSRILMASPGMSKYPCHLAQFFLSVPSGK